MSEENISYYNKCPDCGCSRTLVDYDYVDLIKKRIGKGVKCDHCKVRWNTTKKLVVSQREAKQLLPHLVLIR